MKSKKIMSVILSVALIGSCCAVGLATATPQQDAEFVFESLSNYRLGSMSWGVKTMGLDDLQKKLNSSGKELPEVRVAVIDSGLDTSNKYLAGRYTDDGYNIIKNNTDITDEAKHGTMVSGIIADGTTSNVKILPIKVNGKAGVGKLSDVSKGIYYAIEHDADVINLSLSASDPNHTLTLLDDAIEEAVSKGIVIVVAAGNEKGDVMTHYPSNKDNVLTITATDRKNRICSYSNTGASVDFALPGNNIIAPRNTFAFIASGTSLSAPHAAAAAALLKTVDKSLNQEEIKEILKEYCIDLGRPGFDEIYGWGMIDLSEYKVDGSSEPARPRTTIIGKLIDQLRKRR